MYRKVAASLLLCGGCVLIAVGITQTASRESSSLLQSPTTITMDAEVPVMGVSDDAGVYIGVSESEYSVADAVLPVDVTEDALVETVDADQSEMTFFDRIYPFDLADALRGRWQQDDDGIQSDDAFVIPDNTEFAHVDRVVDGDTVELSDGRTVRLIGIDTPESVHPTQPLECFGIEASNRAKELLQGKDVWLERDVSDTDKYSRTLRYIYTEDSFINLQLVEEGYAFNLTYPPDVKYNHLFLEAEQDARADGRGLWSACDTDWVPPINTDAPDGYAPPDPDCTIKGNIASDGEKIYHISICPYYSKTKISPEKGEMWFCTEEEAVAAGWRKAKNCE